jgi:hypothetical protein
LAALAEYLFRSNIRPIIFSRILGRKRFRSITTDDPDLLDKLLEIKAPTQQLLKDATRRYENAERTKKTLSGSAAMAAYTEPGVGVNAVGWARGRGRGSDAGAAGAKAPWVRDPNLPYTQEQCKKILSLYNVRELCSKCGTKRRRVRNMSVMQAIPLARSASAQVTLTHIVLATGNHNRVTTGDRRG